VTASFKVAGLGSVAAQLEHLRLDKPHGFLGGVGHGSPVLDRALCLGQWQRILLFSFDAQLRPEWTLTLLG
jgi:hypothetical protein